MALPPKPPFDVVEATIAEMQKAMAAARPRRSAQPQQYSAAHQKVDQAGPRLNSRRSP
jgi:hypothetical protein